MYFSQALFEPRACCFQGGDGFVDVLALLLEGGDALAELSQRGGVLGHPAVALVVESEDLPDLGQRQADALAAQDELQAGAVLVGIDPVEAVARRREQPLVLVEAQRARRGAELAAELADGEAAFRTAKFTGHGGFLSRRTLGQGYVGVNVKCGGESCRARSLIGSRSA